MQGKAQAGVTWQSEVRFQEQAGHPIEGVAIPDAQNTTAIYGGAIVKGAPHPEAAQRWLDFIRSPRSEEHTSELQSLMRISYAVFCLKKKKKKQLQTREIET